ncbi:hypothetical protein diail_9176, partial [Diaporthe ilicicola]
LSQSQRAHIAGMVASVDRWVGQWPTELRIQSKARREMVSDLGDMIESRLRLWKDPRHGKHTHLPENFSSTATAYLKGSIRPCSRRWCRCCAEPPFQEVYPPADQKRASRA